MSGAGRPLRFLALVIVGWTAGRVAMLWPPFVSDMPVHPPFGQRGPKAIVVASASLALARRGVVRVGTMHNKVEQALVPDAPLVGPIPSDRDPDRSAFASPSVTRGDSLQPILQQTLDQDVSHVRLGSAFPPLTSPNRPGGSRWSGGFWSIVRNQGQIGEAPFGGQLGGSQAGIRLAYALGQSRRVAVVGRFATPLEGAGREAAIGLEWRPTRLPIRLVAEHRIGIDGGGGGPSIGAIAGVGPMSIGAAFRFEAYGQIGLIERGGIIGFADGAARIHRTIASVGGARLDVGAGLWGGIQPGSQRLDIGPSMGVSIPVAARRVRVSLDWRERVAGLARPSSGLALTVGSDF